MLATLPSRSRSMVIVGIVVSCAKMSCAKTDPVETKSSSSVEQVVLSASAEPVEHAESMVLERPKDQCPSSMILVQSSFCIHRWEAHLIDDRGQMHDPYRVPPFPEQMGEWRAHALPGVVPQGYTGRDQAEIACKNAGFRLCRQHEWQIACRGPQGMIFPYGTQHRIERRCNTHKFPGPSHLVLYFYPHTTWSTSEMNDPRINQVPDGLAPTGQYVDCTNAYGTFDMVGNLQEWVFDLVSEKEHKGNAIALGDHYMGQGRNYEGCEARNVAHGYYPNEPTRNQRDYSTGFRCCADPQ
ncbi:MAG TPA: SUMF1/EgtB/PvdO family nonheme iron enzyme [Polyangiaceae bacterium]|nr:SUMF1/EgtB/PvdO family nonheme iron enzyme [Polyangiaceae bacterium]HNZ20855.1 SUMF1/EgtB/PvdO family nonheme iron enzyme [Polyangiaceae bacterium]HOD21428.1 SUMF1/EgtB/PvdO family nonheme iron enzyme [Polyangiaceae bacterium]HOE47537.1 SUMF1/EgtB/PvdO family nonheme iron enzyme [Polyangiaceae bacterium]HOG98725.1 SUMF1/EgtB/PvdO family nonheme iron enzyme [Polyangiaceae bacterium]